MGKYEKALSMISVVCFGFCLALLAVAIDLKWDSMWFYWCGLMLAHHGVWGGIGIYDFLRRAET